VGEYDLRLLRFLSKIPSPADSSRVLQSVVGLDTLRGRIAALDQCLSVAERLSRGEQVSPGEVRVWQAACGGRSYGELLEERRSLESELGRRIMEASEVAGKYGATKELNDLVSYLLGLYPQTQTAGETGIEKPPQSATAPKPATPAPGQVATKPAAAPIQSPAPEPSKPRVPIPIPEKLIEKPRPVLA